MKTLSAPEFYSSLHHLAKRAQEEHQAMIELLASVDNYVRRANEIQETIVMTKIEADTVHKQFIDCVNKIHELERELSGVEEKRRKRKKEEDISFAQKEASEIFEKFKRGDKLSTEDLMLLQKAGLI